MLKIGVKYYSSVEELLSHIDSNDKKEMIMLVTKLQKSIKQGLWRNRKGAPSWAHITDPAKKSKRLIDIDTIPAKTLRKYKLPSPSSLKKIAQAENTEASLETKNSAIADLATLHKDFTSPEDYATLRFKHSLDQPKAHDLSQAAGWLRLLNHYRSRNGDTGKRNGTKHIGFTGKAELRAAVLTILSGKNLYGFNITNSRVLFEKETAWSKAVQQSVEQALKTLVPQYFGIKNRQVIGKREGEDGMMVGGYNIKEWHASQVLYQHMNPGAGNKFDYEETYFRYELACRKAGKDPVSLGTVKRFLSDDAIREFATWERSGFAELDKYLPHVKGQRAKHSLAKGGYDGFQVDFKTDTGKGVAMLTVVAVFDHMSEAITGYDVGLVENGKMVRNMYRHHLNLTGGRSYYEIESDRFSGNLAQDTREIFQYCCKEVTQPTPNDPRRKTANPKSRFAERYLPELNRLAQNYNGWKGTNITSIDRNRKPNPDYSDTNYVASYEAGVKQVIELINIYNNRKLKKFNGKSRLEMCMENISEKAPTIHPLMQAMYLNQCHITTVRHHVVKVTLGSKPNQKIYEWPWHDADLYVHKMSKGRRVAAYFDENNMDTVSLYSFDEKDERNKDKHIFIHAIDKKLIRAQKAKAEQTHNDLAEIGNQDRYRQQVVARKDRKQLEFEASVYGIDIGGMSLDLARKMVAGARAVQKDTIILPPDQRFAEELSTPHARQHAAYYEDRLLRDNGLQVPMGSRNGSGKTLEQKRKEYNRKKFKK